MRLSDVFPVISATAFKPLSVAFTALSRNNFRYRDGGNRVGRGAVQKANGGLGRSVYRASSWLTLRQCVGVISKT